MMRVIVACEYSGRVREAFRTLGHDAWSCDYLPAEDKSRFHLQQDVRDVLDDGWDLMIAHPDCTYLTNSAAWCYKDDPGKNMSPGVLFGEARRLAREDAVAFVQLLMNAPIKRIAIENPIGVLSSRIRKPSQIIQPYDYGEDASKSTCLWLKNLSLSCARQKDSMVVSLPIMANKWSAGRTRLTAGRTSLGRLMIDGRIVLERMTDGREQWRFSGAG